MFKGLLFWLRERWGVETAFRSLEEFRVRSRTCDVGKELVLVLLSYFLLNVWFVPWRRVRLWEFCESLLEGLELSCNSRGKRGRARVLSWKGFSLKSS
ncbi:hypothetical protein SACC_29180 [Saccharolobus caldissimus]|uniref:Uncharacterized protein n=1 Tax=Saccharolobus caldissimus TaxID=1702097 RepID=A0AAQ4CVS0_9CREN|nr:hypothetical protein SACC_29180 [Saccharolobus caldissimus]